MEIEINFLEQPKLRRPYLISGLPGIAYVGKLSVDHLIKELKAKVFAEIYSKFFPPYVLIEENGLVELLKNELYYWKNNVSERDLIFFTGNAQATTPEGQYLIADKVLDTVLELGCERVYSIAASLTGKTNKKARVFGAVTDLKLISEMKKHKVIMMEKGIIGGANGLMLGLAKTRNIPGLCLLGETQGFRTASGEFLVDANAVRAVLQVLIKTLDINVDLSPLDEEVEYMKNTIKKIAEMEDYIIKKQREAASRGYKNYIT